MGIKNFEQCKAIIMATYPECKPAKEGVIVGDVLINHPKVPAMVVTPKILKHFKSEEGSHALDHFYVIANIGENLIDVIHS